VTGGERHPGKLVRYENHALRRLRWAIALGAVVVLVMGVIIGRTLATNGKGLDEETRSPALGPRGSDSPVILAQFDPDPWIGELLADRDLQELRRDASEPIRLMIEDIGDSAWMARRAGEIIERRRKRVLQAGSAIWHEFYGCGFLRAGGVAPCASWDDAERMRVRINTPEQILRIDWLSDEDIANVIKALDAIGG